MKVFDQLENASLENLAADPTLLPEGRLWLNVTSFIPKIRVNSTIKEFILNDSTQTITNKTIVAGSNTITGLLHGTQVDDPAVAHGATGAIVGTTNAQVITLKDLDGGTATNTSRFTLPKAATGTLAALTRKAGTVFFDTTLSQFFGDDGTSLLPLGNGVYQECVRQAANNYGSTDTFVRRYTNSVTSAAGITDTDTAANATTFTFNVDGTFWASVTDNVGAAGDVIIFTLNSSTLNADPGVGAAMLNRQVMSGSSPASVTATGKVSATDVLRVQMSVATAGGGGVGRVRILFLPD